MKYQWYFPQNAEGGQPEGLNDSGVESFRGNQIESLAREIIQNSTDAIVDKQKPVTVTFDKITVTPSEFPHIKGLTRSFRSARDYKRTPEQAKQFFSKGLEILENEKDFTFLKISDYNTSGLSGVNEEASDWENLVKSIGISNKGGSSGGSFGIGKSAPFACSNLRTVFYSTLNQQGEIGFQGVSRLASHSDDSNYETRGTGFYGIKKNTKAITDPKYIPNFFNRSEPGTDVVVASFLEDKEWQEKIIKAVIENFFFAIYENKLVVKVGSVEINSNNLKSLLDKYIKPHKAHYAHEYFSAIKLGEVYEKEINDLGSVTLFIRTDDDLSKKVAMVRNTGMKITHLDRFRGGTKFSGVLFINGSKLNELLRKTEPPTHDKWEPSRYEDERYAKKVIEEIKHFVREVVKELNKVEESNKIDFKGFNQFLPDHLNEDEPLEDKKTEDVNTFVPKSMRIKPRKIKKASRTSIVNKGLNKKPKQKKNVTSKKNTKGQGGKKQNTKSLSIAKVRSILVDQSQGAYDVSVTTLSGGKGYLTINFVGEDAKAYDLMLDSALDSKNNMYHTVEKNTIGPIIFEDNEKRVFRIQTNEKFRASLEVQVNES
ncbi:hypothetical protein LCM20_08650 [Halobacillus litoralis]|uniref:hypothetical protein n=1 Tax=Halobacillus litoralis TaxID=45668 RepID=UPI001CD6BD34|nr:hypothetical protein [Halobacillus litoralis]MCA0970654.1 hypothetical protein [Halobacillus litoralis]